MITSGVRREIDDLKAELRDALTRLQAVESAAARFADQLDSLATRGKNGQPYLVIPTFATFFFSSFQFCLRYQH